MTYDYPITQEELSSIQEILKEYPWIAEDLIGFICVTSFSILLVLFAISFFSDSFVLDTLLMTFLVGSFMYLGFYTFNANPIYQNIEMKKEIVSAISPSIKDDEKYIAFQESASRSLAGKGIDLAENCADSSEVDDASGLSGGKGGAVYINSTSSSIKPSQTILCTNKDNPVFAKNIKLTSNERLVTVDLSVSANKKDSSIAITVLY